MKLCKDCRHLMVPTGPFPFLCGLTVSIEPVHGRSEYHSALAERSLGACGPEGKLWEAIDVTARGAAA